MDKKISADPILPGAQIDKANDKIPIIDSSASDSEKNKTITISEIETSMRVGQSNGVASLDGSGKVPDAQLPDSVVKSIHAVYADITALLAGQASQKQDAFYYVTDASADATVDAGWAIYRKLAASTASINDYVKVQEQESIDLVVTDATESAKGIAEIATEAEADAGSDDLRFVTPLKLLRKAEQVVNIATATFTPDASHLGKIINLTNATSCVVTLPLSFGVGKTLHFRKGAGGDVTLNAANPGTLQSVGSNVIKQQYALVSATYLGSNAWWLYGTVDDRFGGKLLKSQSLDTDIFDMHIIVPDDDFVTGRVLHLLGQGPGYVVRNHKPGIDQFGPWSEITLFEGKLIISTSNYVGQTLSFTFDGDPGTGIPSAVFTDGRTVKKGIQYNANDYVTTDRSLTDRGYVDEHQLKSFTVVGVPSASPAGRLIYVSNESGGAVVAFSDGTNWRRVTDRAIIS